MSSKRHPRNMPVPGMSQLEVKTQEDMTGWRHPGGMAREIWASDGLIISQFPPGGVIAAPPGTVTITVGHSPPIFAPPIYVIPDKIPGDIA